MDGKGGAASAELLQRLAIRHGRSLHGGPGEYDGLRDARQSKLPLQGGSRGSECRHARRNVIGYSQLIELAHLLGDGAIERWVAGMDTCDVDVLALRGETCS